MKKLGIISLLLIFCGLSSLKAQTTPNNAFADNQAQVEPGVFAIYSGDIDQLGSVDGGDYSIIENDLGLFLFGGYYVSDLNGDGNVDGADYSFIENQVTQFIFAAKP